MKNYDVAIIGGGIGGLMTAHRLTTSNPNLNVVIYEKGMPLNKRVCPIVTKHAKSCINCKSCAIMEGLAGAGAFSDGKYVISTEYGGWLPEFLEGDTVIDYIEQADKILVSYGATTERFMPNNELKKLCMQNDLHMSQAQLKHLGTDFNYITMQKMIEDLETRCEIVTGAEVLAVDKASHTLTYKKGGSEESVRAEKIVFAVGRVGSGFFSKWCRENGISLRNNQIDIGVRVELPSIIWEDFAKKIYEPKILYRSEKYGDTTRMFCFNDRGHVVTENTNGILSVNGHSYADETKKTKNTNFALLSTIRFTEPFKEPIEYARDVAKLANLISGGSVMVQTFGDLMRGRRSDDSRIRKSTTRPTLDAVPGDLSLCMPKRQLDNIIETIYALDKIAPGTANRDTLLYGIECKYYSARPTMTDFVLESCDEIYAVGDGAGITRSLSQASANGLYVADEILKKI